MAYMDRYCKQREEFINRLNPVDRPLDNDEREGGYRKIFLSGRKGKGKFAKVSMDDYLIVRRIIWHLYDDKETCYATGTVFYENGGRKRTSMHRFIMGEPEGMEVNHDNWDGLDNRRENLRICSKRQNTKYQKVKIGKKDYCDYKGVFHRKESGRFRVIIEWDGHRLHAGEYEIASDGAHAYDYFARLYHGEFAALNFPDEFWTKEMVEEKRYKRTKDSSYNSVYWRKTINKWTVTIWVNGKCVHGGCFTSEIEAALTADKLIRQYGLDKSKLNFPQITTYDNTSDLVAELSV